MKFKTTSEDAVYEGTTDGSQSESESISDLSPGHSSQAIFGVRTPWSQLGYTGSRSLCVRLLLELLIRQTPP